MFGNDLNIYSPTTSLSGAKASLFHIGLPHPIPFFLLNGLAHEPRVSKSVASQT